ncbi:MAG: hypothetical protein HZB61_09865 [Nitrospirae bacterium]|nr:hypothetical protein [Nitrospirota bacterium]
MHNIYKELFDDKEAHILMERTASSFFIDLNKILLDYTLLEFAKITDPAITKGQENFTIENLIESIDWPQGVQQTLSSLNDKARAFRSHIIKARHKLLAHYDKDIFLNDTILGEFPAGEDEIFLKILEEICDIVHTACFGSIFGSISVAMHGDVQDLKKTLERALAFDRLFSESTGNEKGKLLSYLISTKNKTI